MRADKGELATRGHAGYPLRTTRPQWGLCPGHSALGSLSTEAAVAACSVYMCEYEQDGEVAQRIAAVIPYYPYKGIPRFCAPHLTWRFDAWP